MDSPTPQSLYLYRLDNLITYSFIYFENRFEISAGRYPQFKASFRVAILS
jgi:hypothetical protein